MEPCMAALGSEASHDLCTVDAFYRRGNSQGEVRSRRAHATKARLRFPCRHLLVSPAVPVTALAGFTSVTLDKTPSLFYKKNWMIRFLKCPPSFGVLTSALSQ